VHISKMFFGNNSSVSMSSNNSKNSVVINGKKIDLPPGNVSIINGKIYVDNKEIDIDNEDFKNAGIVNVSIHGNVDKVDCNGSVQVQGEVKGSIECNGSVNIVGNVTGDIDCGGSVRITGDHKGEIDAGGSVHVE
jgi:hypothetical protein